MRIAMMTSVHRDDDVRIFQKMCKSLAAAGNEVHLIVPRHNGADEEKDGVRLHAIHPARSRFGRMTRMQWNILRKSLALNADVYHFHDPELLLVGTILRGLGKRVVYDVHEELPKQILSKEWIPRRLRTIVSQIAGTSEYLMSRLMTGVVAATPAIARRFPSNRCILVQNYPTTSEEVSSTDSSAASPHFQVVYIGGITRSRGLVQMVEAMELLPKTSDVRLVVAGLLDPPDLVSQLQTQPGMAYVQFIDWLCSKDVRQLLDESHVGIVTLLPVPQFIESMPTKLFEYMAAGLPVIASDFPLWRQIVTDANVGLLVDPTNPQAIADAIDWMRSHPDEAAAMGQRGQRAVREIYNWNIEVRKLLEFYRELDQKDSHRRGGAATVHQGSHCESSNGCEPEIARGDRSHGATL